MYVKTVLCYRPSDLRLWKAITPSPTHLYPFPKTKTLNLLPPPVGAPSHEHWINNVMLKISHHL